MNRNPAPILKFMSADRPYRIEFSGHGAREEGFLYVAEQGDIPFLVRRTFWTVNTPATVVRGGHAHHKTEMVLIALQGTIILHVEDKAGTQWQFKLDRPDTGIYIPVMHWHTMVYEDQAVQLVLASADYEEQDYIRDFQAFKRP